METLLWHFFGLFVCAFLGLFLLVGCFMSIYDTYVQAQIKKYEAQTKLYEKQLREVYK